MELSLQRCMVALACVACLGTAPASAEVVVQKGDGDDEILAVTASAPGDRSVATFICNGKTGQFGIVLVLGSGSAAADGADVTIKADATVLARRHFDQFQTSLMLTADGDAGRALLAKAMRADIVELDVAGRPIRFALADGRAETERYRTACDL